MSNYTYIFVMALVTFLIRALPMTLIKKPIKNVFLQSFLYYVPYVTLAVMTFPAIIEATSEAWFGLVALAVGIVCAYLGVHLFGVAVSCFSVVLILEYLIPYIS